MNNTKDIAQVENKKRNTNIGTSGSINRTKLRLADSLTPHRRTYCIARAIHIAYGKLFGRAHMLPNTYIIGFAKCGTTSLNEYLVKHPQIYGGFIKEVHYFDHGKRFMRGTNWYRSNFPFIIQGIIQTCILHKKAIVIDATPRYINHPHAMRRIKKITPNAKFIVIVRNPIERAYSHYNSNKSDPHIINEDISFAKAIHQEEQRIEGQYKKMEDDESYHSTKYYSQGYAQGGLYVKWLQNWIKEFGSNVLVLDNGALLTDTQSVIDTITKFLELDHYKLEDTKKHNVGEYGDIKMDKETRTLLSEYYEKPNAQLYSLLGRDLGWK